MRRGLKLRLPRASMPWPGLPRARPAMRRGLKLERLVPVGRIVGPPRARPPMRRGLKHHVECQIGADLGEPRARPPMRRGLKQEGYDMADMAALFAARAAPYEKGTETTRNLSAGLLQRRRGARGPMSK